MAYIALPFRLPATFKPDRDAPPDELEPFPLEFPIGFGSPPKPRPGPKVRGWITRAKLLAEGN